MNHEMHFRFFRLHYFSGLINLHTLQVKVYQQVTWCPATTMYRDILNLRSKKNSKITTKVQCLVTSFEVFAFLVGNGKLNNIWKKLLGPCEVIIILLTQETTKKTIS